MRCGVARVLLGLMLLAVLPDGAAMAQCVPPSAAARNPTVHLDVLEPRLVYRHDLDLRGLASFSDTFETAPAEGAILGLTRRNDQVSLRVRADSVSLPDGRICIWAEDIQAMVGDPEMDVYVAANYQVGTCEYNVVLQHENQHVAINRSVLQAYAPRIGAGLREAVHRLFPMITTHREDLQRLPDILIDAIRPVWGSMQRELRERNGTIDTPESYRRTATLCTNWFPPGTRMPSRR